MMTEGRAADLLLEGRAVKFPGGDWRVMAGVEPGTTFYLWEPATEEDARLLETVAVTMGVPGPAAEDAR